MSGPAPRVVIVGGGVAGLRTAETLRAHGFTGELLGLGAENHPPYARPPLSKAMLHGHDGAGAELSSTAEIRWRLGVTATSLHLDGRYVGLDNGGRVEFDVVVLATGVRARTLPGAAQALALRTVEDSHRLRLVLRRDPGHLVVIGAGFIGSEVAVAARVRGWKVTVVDVDATPLAGALGHGPAQWLWEQHRVRGVHTRFGAPVVSVEKVGAGWDVLLPGGVVIAADAVVTGLGAKPNTEWLDGSGLDITDGVLTNERRQAVTAGGTVTSNVVAVGDVARTPSPLSEGRAMRWEHWTAATNDARCAAAALTGREPRPEAPAVFWTDVYHHRIQVIGLHRGTESEPEPGPRGFCVSYRSGEVLHGAVVVNWPQRIPGLQREIAEFGVIT